MSGIDLSRSPYFGSFDANNNYYKILFRPAVATQTRELNDLQDIQQDQISKFARTIYKDGSVIEGCAFSFDKNYSFVKINDNYSNGTAFTISSFIDFYVMNSNGLKAQIVNVFPGYQAQDPDTNTLYIKYVNSVLYPNGVQQSIFSNSEQLNLVTDSNVSLGNVTVFTPNTLNSNSVASGVGYAFTTDQGTIYKNGYFVTVKPQTIVIQKYNNYPDGISVGFQAVENIITPESNSSLNDNAGGSPNYSAPGAHRYQIIPKLITMVTNNISNTTPFFSLCDFQSGVPTSIKNDPQYSILGSEMARRGFETNGDYVVNPFQLSTSAKPSSDPLFSTYNNLVCSRGLGYVKGYRSEFLNNVTIPIRKATNYTSENQVITTMSYGNYLTVNNFCGNFGLNTISKVELHNVAKQAISNSTFLSSSYSTATRIGYAYLRGFEYITGIPGSGSDQYYAYLFDITMNSGQSFSSVRSIINYSASIKGVADVITVYSASSNSYIAQLVQPSLNKMIFPVGQKALKNNGFNNQSYVYRKMVNASFSNTSSGIMTVSLGSTLGTATEEFDLGGYLSVSADGSFIVTPTGSGSSTNKTGTVNATSGNTIVLGNTTSFLTEYNTGDWITINGVTQQIAQIQSAVSLTLAKVYSGTTATVNVHAKAFLAGVPLNFTTPARSITVGATSANFSLAEALSGSFNASVYFDVLRSKTVPIQKSILRNRYVAINCASHAANSVGPFSLGLVDVVKINAIYISGNGSFSNVLSNEALSFNFDNGQRDDRYQQATIIPVVSGIISANSRILIDLDVFTYNQSQGVGFFNANSYPIDDANTANTSAIRTQDIPQYTASDGTIFDLRDCLDFRPFANNDANTSANSSNWAAIASINPNQNANLIFSINPSYGSFLPTPDTNHMTDLQYYLPRKDKVVLTTGGTLQIIEGSPSLKPIAPIDSPSSMTLGIVTIPPYPTLVTQDAKKSNRYDYAMQFTITQNKRYTMADVGHLASRIENLEYYTSLSQLEQKTTAMVLSTGANGQNRFSHGMLVEPFQGTDIADTTNPTFHCCIDSSNNELRPAIESFTKLIWTDDSDLPFNTSQFIFQNHSSIAINCFSSAINHNGRIHFYYLNDCCCDDDHYSDPDVCNDFAHNSHWINIHCRPTPGRNDDRSPRDCDWGHWRHYDRSARTRPEPRDRDIGITDQFGNPLASYYASTRDSFDVVQVSTETSAVTQYTGDNDIFTDCSVLDYVKARDIPFIATGLKPNTTVWAFLGGTYHVTAYCRKSLHGFREEDTQPFGVPLVTNASGLLYGKLSIPRGVFRKGIISLTLADTDDIVANFNLITTRADGNLYTSFHDDNDWDDWDACDDFADRYIRLEVNFDGATRCHQPPFRDDSDEFHQRDNDDHRFNKLVNFCRFNNLLGILRKPEDTNFTQGDDDKWNVGYKSKGGFRDCRDVENIPHGRHTFSGSR